MSEQETQMNTIGDKMNGPKYKELKDMMGLLNHKVTTQHRLGQSMLVLLKNFSAQIDSMKELATSAGLFTIEEFNAATDSKLGLKLRAQGEKIAIGDTVWVKYRGTMAGEPEFSEELPLRFGSKAVIFEPALDGRSVGDKDIKFSAIWEQEGPHKGKNIEFTIEILRAKTRSEVEEELMAANEGVEDGTGTTDAGVEGQSESQSQVDGLGHEERIVSPDQPVQH